jgi:CrcB protein
MRRNGDGARPEPPEDSADGSCVEGAGVFLLRASLVDRYAEGHAVLRLVGLIGVGSGLGGIARFLLSSLMQQRTGTTFPVGTLVVNVTGSLLLGFLLRYALATPSISTEVRALLTTGFLGGYTTFSTFSYETVALVEAGDYRRASLYVVLSVLGALAGVWAGIIGARELIAWRGRI